jgi:tripartite-type tricarboxylate transporter receptor subunit TctC
MKLLRACILMTALVAGGATAVAGNDGAAYPSKPIRIVVPFSAGSIVDIRARQLSDRLAKNIGQPVIVDNRPGASTIIGANLVAKAPPDGYTVLMASGAIFVVTPAVVESLPFDPIKDFVPLTQYASGPMLLVVHPALGVNSVNELIALARAKPGELSCALSGVGTSAGIMAELFKQVANVEIRTIAYKSEAPALSDVIAGHVPMIFSFLATSSPFIKQGKLKALMQTGAKCLKGLPDVPTASEAGLPDATLTAWGGLWAPAGTPKPIVTRLSAELRRVILSEDYRRILEESGSEPHASTPEEFAAFIDSERPKWARVVKRAGITAEQ